MKSCTSTIISHFNIHTTLLKKLTTTSLIVKKIILIFKIKFMTNPVNKVNYTTRCILLLFCVFLISLTSCKKQIDAEKEKHSFIDRTKIQNTELLEIADDIESRASIFVARSFFKENGQLLWDKAVAIGNPQNQSQVIQITTYDIRKNDTENKNNRRQWFIPLTKDNKRANAILICEKVNNKFRYNLITPMSIKTAAAKGGQVNTQAIVYAKLNNLAFGITEFPEILVSDFARGTKNNSTYAHKGLRTNVQMPLRLLTEAKTVAPNTLVLMQFCVTTNRLCNYTSCVPKCDLCSLCITEDCIEYWDDDGTGLSTEIDWIDTGNDSYLSGGGSGTAPAVLALETKISLTQAQRSWLSANPYVAVEILEGLVDQNEITAEIISASLITIEMSMANKLDETLDYQHESIITSNMPSYPGPFPILQYNIALKTTIAMLKAEHPEWNKVRLYWESTKEIVHTGLDIIGLFPVAGEVADLLNGVIYSIEGEGTLAALSYASAAPFLGWWTAGSKFSWRVINTSGGKSLLKFTRLSNQKVWFGTRGQLRKVVGLKVGDAKQAHHIIPWEFTEHNVVQLAAKKNGKDPFHMNELLNGIALEKSVHIEGMVHTSYNSAVQAKLNSIISDYASSGKTLTPELARTEIEALIVKIRNWIQQNPGVNLNNIVIP